MSEKTADTGGRTLLLSVAMSSPGPFFTGWGMLMGRSSTQLADFIRRTAELAAIIVAWAIFRLVHKTDEVDEDYKCCLERRANLCVGAAMCFSGTAMLAVALFSPARDTGDVRLGLIISVMGMITNTWFWLRYRRLDRAQPDAILAVQSRLYRAKAVVDTCITLALSTVTRAPGTAAAFYMDVGGSIVVAFYLAFCGMNTIRRTAAIGVPAVELAVEMEE